MSQRDLIRRELRAGPCTSVEMAAITELPRKHCAAHLSWMEQHGEVRVIGMVRAQRIGRTAKIYSARGAA